MAVENLHKLSKRDTVEGVFAAVRVENGHASLITQKIAMVEDIGKPIKDGIYDPTEYGKSLKSGVQPPDTLLTGEVKHPADFIKAIPQGWGIPVLIDTAVLSALLQAMIDRECCTLLIEPVNVGETVPFVAYNYDGEVGLAGLLSAYKPKDDDPAGDMVLKFFREFKA